MTIPQTELDEWVLGSPIEHWWTMLEVQGLRTERRGELAEVIIDRPAKHNAISFEMWTQLPALCAEIDADDTVKALIVRGAGANFSAGADISEFGTHRSTPAAATEYGERIEAATAALDAMRKPSVAVIHGFCIGGGCELAAACDLRFAAADATFAITPAKLGIVFGFASTRRLVSLTGASFARYLLYSGLRVDAEHALRVGLVDRVEPPTRLDTVTQEFLDVVCSRSQVSVQGSKKIIAKIVAGQYVADDEARNLMEQAVERADYREGVDAFLSKRAPKFTVV